MNTGAAIEGSAERTPRKRADASARMSHAPVERGEWSDLGARVLSSLILIPLALGAAWAGGPWLAGACGAACVAMSYEWARMSEPEAFWPAFWFAFAGALGAVMITSWRELDLGLAWLALCGAASATRRRSFQGVVETAGGGFCIGFSPSVFLWLRERAPEGLETVLCLFTIIWAADIFAYFGGKLIGGPKIAEGLSPNKTWSGIVTGTAAGAGAGLGCAALFQAAEALWLPWAGIGAILAFTGLMGDLFESFLKRRFGVKDASRLIPGHGGVLDRIDGLMAATALTGAALALWPGLPRLLLGAGP
jgi:phosphatidate cytidylyltransferase